MSNNFPPPPPTTDTKKKVSFGKIAKASGHRVVLYGPGGIGKTSLAAQLPGMSAFFDLDESLPRLKDNIDTTRLTVVDGANTWDKIRLSLSSDGWETINNIIIDSGTKAEEICVAHTLGTVKSDKGSTASSIESYGYGKGYQHVYETFLPILADLDRHCRAGRNVILICHDCTAPVPNPMGDDYIRYEPRLQNPSSGKASIRLRVKEWADHVLFYGYDVAVDKDGKGKGSGTRTIYTAELPMFMAKSRTTQETIPVTPGADVWAQILK